MRNCFSILAGSLVAISLVGGCEGDGPKKTAKTVDPIVRDVPSVLRGTIGAEASIRGIEPVLVSGLGVVVGLPGTGGGPYPTQIQATMERELARRGLGRATQNEDHPFAGMTPKQILDDPNVAVVVVEGVVPPGAPRDGVFDVRVRKLPGSSTTSLEGGTLWSTELRFGPASTFGGAQSRKLGDARGAVFINPFAEPSADAEKPEADGIIRTAGRILGGGKVTEPLSLELVMDNSSHARASAIQNAINSRFPIEPGQREATARGRGPASIALTIPPSYRDRSGEFIRLVQGLRTDPIFGEEYAKRAAEELEATPALSEQLSWILQAVGKPALPFMNKLYESSELLPRMAALRAGARLGDPQASGPLRRLALDPRQSLALRAEAAELLGSTPLDPSTDLALRELVSDENLELRLAAYEAMVERNDASITRTRLLDKFDLDLVPSTRELIYVTQTGKPRIVVFGREAAIKRPLLTGIWGDRLMLAGETSEEEIRVLFRDPRGGPSQQTTTGASLSEFIKLLSHKTSPEAPETGFNLSYSQVVGALYQLQNAGAISAGFAVERDRLVDRLAEAQNQDATDDRPENKVDADIRREARARMISVANKPEVKPTAAAPGSMVVPLPPKVQK